MKVEVTSTTFYLDSNDPIHADMISEFADATKLEYFKLLLEADPNTAFAIYNQGKDLFDKEAHIKDIDAAYMAHVHEVLKEYDYENAGDIAAYIGHPLFGSEAYALRAWYWATYDIFLAYKDEVTGATAKTIEQFISDLPIFNKR